MDNHERIVTRPNMLEGLRCAQMPSLHLGIATKVLLHPQVLDPSSALLRRSGLNLVSLPKIATTNATDQETKRKILKKKTNIHLVCHSAIRLFASTEDDNEPMTVRTIDVDPGLLLYGESGHALASGDLHRALSGVRGEVAPLLAHPRDIDHIIPGLVGGKRSRAWWRYINCSVTFSHTALSQCHLVGHPYFGRAEGDTPKALQIGTKGDDMVITLQSVTAPEPADSGKDWVEAPGIRATVSLKDQAMLVLYRDCGGTVRFNERTRLTWFAEAAPASIHQKVMNEMEGLYIAPLEQPPKGRALTSRVIAWMSAATPRSAEDLRANLVAISNPSESTLKRLKNDLKKELNNIKTLPLSTRFAPGFIAPGTAVPTSPSMDRVDPRISELYA